MKTTASSTERTLAHAAPATGGLDGAERIVYLFPEGFDAEGFLAGQLDGERIFEWTAVERGRPDRASRGEPAVLCGTLRGQDFAIEVRPRTATVIAARFDVRRDVLLALKEVVERRGREASPASPQPCRNLVE